MISTGANVMPRAIRGNQYNQGFNSNSSFQRVDANEPGTSESADLAQSFGQLNVNQGRLKQWAYPTYSHYPLRMMSNR